jgi:crossover junction endodeoxyribonuclease RuvC
VPKSERILVRFGHRGFFVLILGLDPGLATTGYGIIDAQPGSNRMITCGAILTQAGVPIAERLVIIYDQITMLLNEYHPEAAAVEQLFFNKNATSALAVGQARGVSLLCLSQHRLFTHEYTPLQVKSSLTGNGRAEKAQVGFMVRALLNLKEVPRPDDVADALAVAICHSFHASSPIARL